MTGELKLVEGILILRGLQGIDRVKADQNICVVKVNKSVNFYFEKLKIYNNGHPNHILTISLYFLVKR